METTFSINTRIKFNKCGVSRADASALEALERMILALDLAEHAQVSEQMRGLLACTHAGQIFLCQLQPGRTGPALR